MVNREKKRKKSVGLGASEIAFIEDEIAAVAMEYGLEMDDDVAKNIAKRKPSSKRKSSAVVAQPAKMDATGLLELLPKQCQVGPCKSPGCNCRGYSVDKKKHDQCHKCDHGVFLHSLVFTKRDDDAKGLHGQVLMGLMHSIVVLGRLAGSVVGSHAWTQASLDLLSSALNEHLKDHLIKHQNDKEFAAERPLMTKLSTDLHALITAAMQAVAASGRSEMRIKLACYFDQMYFGIYHTTLCLYGRGCGAVPSPDEYLQLLTTHGASSDRDYEVFIATELLRDGLPDDFHAPYEISKRHKDPIVLFEMLQARLREGIQLFYEPGMGMGGEMDKAIADLGRSTTNANKRLTKKQRMNQHKVVAKPKASVPAYPLLQQWRENVRVWLDKLYAPAIPHPDALKAIAAHSPLIEIGAGLGYWSSLLLKQKADILPFDKQSKLKWSTDMAPIDVDDDEVIETLDAIVPPFTKVYEGGAEVLELKPLKGRTLLLCAPPQSSLARDALRHYKGRYLIHIGEWYGETGDRQFECDVMKHFTLLQRIALPNYTDTAHEVTIWDRKATSSELAIVACSSCDSSQTTLLRRCTLCKTCTYCTSECMRQDHDRHLAEHARRLIFLHDEHLLEFENPLHFAPFDAVEGGRRDDTERVFL
ncbi:hypothetical protein SPRG_20076 [Saprolegnia parasitica CBS 223.65]|uniref:MYND-type domain-containing protein n=1 Tax=Saprolegnia parasitica (strain CBS 223.65) TaxID=695850 RepID=A0A067CR02_SAPPC|nr:hypothetical protein SPRG_20076 [Saprolegnia parasitica CBS 223.65]KDO28971.1 hypothetical protein SPRG_20076 [Saprolegnia parasitica CBS 223.65]|eukprot:XP_012200307.1 hypothetical protein SPRG_20076 [Saprolegnia parasitica CBS 223.65]